MTSARKKKRRVSNFILDEAEMDDDSDPDSLEQGEEQIARWQGEEQIINEIDDVRPKVCPNHTCKISSNF